MIDDEPNASICPLCGGRNNCALAVSAESGEPCWCESLKIPEGVLQQIPLEARNKSGVCREGLERHVDYQAPIHFLS